MTIGGGRRSAYALRDSGVTIGGEGRGARGEGRGARGEGRGAGGGDGKKAGFSYALRDSSVMQWLAFALRGKIIGFGEVC